MTISHPRRHNLEMSTPDPNPHFITFSLAATCTSHLYDAPLWYTCPLHGNSTVQRLSSPTVIIIGVKISIAIIIIIICRATGPGSSWAAWPRAIFVEVCDITQQCRQQTPINSLSLSARYRRLGRCSSVAVSQFFSATSNRHANAPFTLSAKLSQRSCLRA